MAKVVNEARAASERRARAGKDPKDDDDDGRGVQGAGFREASEREEEEGEAKAEAEAEGARARRLWCLSRDDDDATGASRGIGAEGERAGVGEARRVRDEKRLKGES